MTSKKDSQSTASELHEHAIAAIAQEDKNPESPPDNDTKKNSKFTHMRAFDLRRLCRINEGSLLDNFSRVLLRFALVIGVGFTMLEYNRTLYWTQVERSLGHVKTWETDQNRAARLTLALAIRSARYAHPKLEKNKIGYLLHRNIRNESNSEIHKYFNEIFHLLNSISYCVNSNICDKAIIDGYFKDYATQFWEYFGKSVLEIRKINKSDLPLQKFIFSNGRPQ